VGPLQAIVPGPVQAIVFIGGFHVDAAYFSSAKALAVAVTSSGRAQSAANSRIICGRLKELIIRRFI